MNLFAVRNAGGALALALVLNACADNLGPDTARPEPPELGGSATLASVECLVDVPAASVVCRTPGPGGGPRGPRLAILASTQIKLASSNIVSDTAGMEWRMDVTMQNLMAEAVGTPDGVLKVGSKVFHDTGPAVTAYKQVGDTGTVTVKNADGVGNFTKANQPYHLYDTILAPQAVSAPRLWVLHVPRTVKTFRLSMKVFTPMPSEPKVPDAAPDSVPASTYAPDKIATNLPVMSGTYVRDVVTVLFRPGTSQQDRQAAVNAVSGTVIGGYKIADDDGEYYVRIADDGTAQPLLNAVERLAGLPQVIGTGPEFLEPEESLAYLKPADNPRFNDWELRPALADSLNWGLETIQAPYAWGCTTGSTATRIAVVDQGFHLANVQDIAVNTRSISRDYAWPTTKQHGVMVTSALAARGNNGAGISGVMWNAGLELHGVGLDGQGQPTILPNGMYGINDATRGLSAAIASGAPIVSMSIAFSWPPGHTPGSTADQRRLNNHYRRIKGHVWWHELLGRTPLLVLPSGNISSQVDAKWSSYPQLVNDFGERVLIVGAAGHSPAGLHLWGRSQSGPLVSIAAPGEKVGVLTAVDTLGATSGTSLAVPMVTGVAGLLLSMNPDLRSHELKSLIMEAAAAAGATVPNPLAGGTTPVLNAYQALRKAAERTGGPLCGNRVWITAGGAVFAARGGGASEHLFSVAPNSDWVAGMHGGDVRVYDSGRGTSVYRWSRTGWSRVADSDSAYNTHGPVLGSGTFSHGKDSLLVMTEQSNVQMFMRSRTTQGSRLIGTVAASLGSTSSTSYVCVRMVVQSPFPEGSCTDSVAVGASTSTGRGPGAYSPRGDTATLGIYRTEGSATVTEAFAVCPNQDMQWSYVYYCRGYTTTQRTAGSTIYHVSSAGVGVVTTLPGRIVDLSMADGPSADLYARAEHAESKTVFRWVPRYQNAVDPYASGWEMTPDPAASESGQSCLAVFHNVATGARTTIPGCQWNGGTMAPVRQPTAARPGASRPAESPAPRGLPAQAAGTRRSR